MSHQAARFNSKLVMQSWIFEKSLTPLNPNFRINLVSGLARGSNGGIGMVGRRLGGWGVAPQTMKPTFTVMMLCKFMYVYVSMYA